MKNLRNLLERFTRSLDKDTVIKGFTLEVIKRRTGITLQEAQLALKEGVLEVTAGAATKNELRLKEEAIRAELKEVHNINIVRVLYK